MPLPFAGSVDSVMMAPVESTARAPGSIASVTITYVALFPLPNCVEQDRFHSMWGDFFLFLTAKSWLSRFRLHVTASTSAAYFSTSSGGWSMADSVVLPSPVKVRIANSPPGCRDQKSQNHPHIVFLVVFHRFFHGVASF